MNTPTQNPSVQVVPFIAESAQDAVAQIRARLGAEAVVLNVRQLPADGLAKLWKSPRIEVLAYKPEVTAASALAPSTGSGQGTDPLAELKKELQAIRQQLGSAPGGPALGSESGWSSATPGSRPGARLDGIPTWRVGEVLQTSGLAPVHVQRIVESLQYSHGETPPASLAEELVMARAALSGLW